MDIVHIQIFIESHWVSFSCEEFVILVMDDYS